MSVEAEAITKTDVEVAAPKLYNVILHNDDKTTMDFVLAVLDEIFHHDDATAYDIMMRIHERGQGIVAQYAYEIASQKVSDTINFARGNGFPLLATMEEAK